MIHERFAERFEDWLGLVQDHHTVYGSSAQGRISAGNPRDGFVGDPEAGLFYHPTLVDGVTLDDEIYRTETFGPIVGASPLTRRCRGGDRVGEPAGATAYRHRSIRPTGHLRVARSARTSVPAWAPVNNSTSGAEAHLPFGGNGRSGNGSRQSGVWVLDQFTRWQSMNWDYSGKLQKAQMDNVAIEADTGFRL